MAAEDPDPSGIFAIALSDSEDDGAAAQDAGAGTTTTASHSRTGQSEEEFQAVRRAYRVKVENGEIAKTVQVPRGRVTKPDAQALLHAVEELYYFKRFREGVDFARRVLDQSGDGLDEDTRKTLEHYAARCQSRADTVPAGGSQLLCE